MKIIELLGETSKKLRAYRSPPLVRAKALATSNETKQALIAYEEALTIKQLSTLFTEADQEVSAATLHPFIQFLANRWMRLNDKDLYEISYNRTYKKYITQICVTLARELSVIDYDGKTYHYLELLIPTIITYNSNLLMDLKELDESIEEDHLRRLAPKTNSNKPQYLTMANSSEELKSQAKALAAPDKIQLHHFILDHWGNVIDIRDSIRDTINTGELRHTSDTVTALNEEGLVPGFEFKDMTQGIRNKTVRMLSGVLYIYLDGNLFSYLAQGMSEPAVIQAKQLGINERPLTMSILENHQVDILELTTLRGHTQIRQQPRPLLPYEQKRVIYHSKHAFKQYSTLQALAAARAKVFNAYDAIMQLVKHLRQGGMHGGRGGLDMVSGLSSYVGVRQFYDFTWSISEADFTYMMSINLPYRGVQLISINDLWSELLATSITQPESNFTLDEQEGIRQFIGPHFDDIIRQAEEHKESNKNLPQAEKQRFKRPILCAEQFADKFMEVANSYTDELRNIIPINNQEQNDNNINEKADLEVKRKSCQKNWNRVIRHNRLTHFTSEHKDLPQEALAALYPSFPFYKFIHSMVSNAQELVNLLAGTASEFNKIIIFNLAKNQYLQKLMCDSNSIVNLCHTVKECNVLDSNKTLITLFLAVGKPYLQDKFSTEAQKSQLKAVIPLAIYLDFFCYQKMTQLIDFGFLQNPKRPVDSAPLPITKRIHARDEDKLAEEWPKISRM